LFPRADTGVSLNQTKVLVVDDEVAIRDMIAFALDRAGMHVQVASDAKEALVSITRQRPDIILMDWMMPGAKGNHPTSAGIIPRTFHYHAHRKVTEDAGRRMAAPTTASSSRFRRGSWPVRAVSPHSADDRENFCQDHLDTISRRVTHLNNEIHLGRRNTGYSNFRHCRPTAVVD
jgi:hypothetical protein